MPRKFKRKIVSKYLFNTFSFLESYYKLQVIIEDVGQFYSLY